MVATITILSNSRCQVTGLDKSTTRLLDEALAMPIPGSHFQEAVRSGRWDGKRHLFYVASNTFPKGLLQRVQALLTEAEVEFEMVDNRTLLPEPEMARLEPGMLSGVVLRKYQVKAARKALKASCGILWLATNAGKTEVACAMIGVLKERRCLFLVHKKTLLSQTRSRIATRFNTIEEHIGIIGEGQFNPKHITVATIQSLTRKQAKPKMKIIAAYLKTIQLLFVDEGHHAKATTWYRLVNRIPAQYRYLLSGTPFGSGNGLMVEAACGPVVARVSNKKLIRLGHSAVPTIRMIEINEPVIDSESSWDDVYKQGIVLNTARNARIAQEAAHFAKDKQPTLILIKELWQGDTLCTMLKGLGVKHRFVHGKMPQSMIENHKACFEEGKFFVLIASAIFDEGVDVPAIRSLIVADGGKSVRSVLQKIGRGLRQKESGTNVLAVVDFADNTHKWLASHSMDRLAIYQGEGFDVVA